MNLLRPRVSIGELMGLIVLAAIVFAVAREIPLFGPLLGLLMFFWLFPCYERTVREMRYRRATDSPLVFKSTVKLGLRWLIVGFVMMICIFFFINLSIFLLVLPFWFKDGTKSPGSMDRIFRVFWVLVQCVAMFVYWWVMFRRLKLKQFDQDQ